MMYLPQNVATQAILVLRSGVESTTSTYTYPNDNSSGKSLSVTQDALGPDSQGNYPSCTISVYLNSSVEDPRSAHLIIDSSFSSIPVIWESELSHEYSELGEALAELTEIEESEGLGIEQPVFAAASSIALQLMANSYPAPRIFNHGPRSVVFNWTEGFQNLYLTISADKVSALMSIPAKIQRRIDYSMNSLLNPALVLRSLESASRQQPVALISPPAPKPSKSIL